MHRRAAAAVLGIAMALPACAWNPPTVAPLRTEDAATTKVFAADGSLITLIHGEENREPLPLEEMSQSLRNAVVAAEDERFWNHRGVDVKAVLRAAYENTSEGDVVEGGSTITQQLVKTTMVGGERTLRRKIREAAMAYQLEQRFTKERILELYLNTIYFGNGAYGAEAAAQEYFGTSARDLTIAQAALLAGIIRSPNTLDPFDNADQATARRNDVLDRLVSVGVTPRDEAEAAKTEPLGLRTKAPSERYIAPHFVEVVKRFILEDPRFGATPQERLSALLGGGLRIHTTLDPAAQVAAERARDLILREPASDPAAGIVTVEPGTGAVRALVGGRDFFSGEPGAKFDLATQATRPAGSAFKPFVLAAALDEGIGLTRRYPAPPRLSIDRPRPERTWVVDNYEGSGGGFMDLYEATIKSVNTVYAQLILEVGPADAVQMAKSLGVRSPLQPVPSAVLGTNDVSPLDMASAYATLANRGVRVEPTFVSKVLRNDGTVLFQHRPKRTRVLDAYTADTLVPVLQAVVDHGTGINARLGRPVAGKTGTGQRWRDAWFVGFTPQLATAVWVGFQDEQREMIPPTTRITVSGGSWPAQIFQLYMAEAHAAVPAVSFPPAPLPEEDTTASTGRIVGSATTVGDDRPRRELPNVIGLREGPASDVLSEDGFRVRISEAYSEDYPPGYVVGQEPAARAMVPAGSVVVLSVSLGAADMRTVPSVLGMTEVDATARLTDAGFRVDAWVEAESDPNAAAGRAGRVWRQSPSGSSRAPAGSTVTITVNPE